MFDPNFISPPHMPALGSVNSPDLCERCRDARFRRYQHDLGPAHRIGQLTMAGAGLTPNRDERRRCWNRRSTALDWRAIFSADDNVPGSMSSNSFASLATFA